MSGVLVSKPPVVSVALTTCNGSKYLPAQLESLRIQTRPPDEVIICDDGSSDETVTTVEAFIAQWQLSDGWRVHRNGTQKGVDRNFIDCAKMTRGDIVFFCDQDDLWGQRKIERVLDVFRAHPAADAVNCRHLWADANGRPIRNVRNLLVRNSGRARAVSLAEQVRNNRSAGLTLAFRPAILADVERLVLRYGLPYDLPFGLVCAIRGTYYMLDEVLVLHRVHSCNASTPVVSVDERLRDIDFYVRGRRLRASLMRAAIGEYGHAMSGRDRARMVYALARMERAISNLEGRRLWALLWSVFDANPMMSRLLLINDFLCGVRSAREREVRA